MKKVIQITCAKCTGLGRYLDDTCPRCQGSGLTARTEGGRVVRAKPCLEPKKDYRRWSIEGTVEPVWRKSDW